MTNRLSPVRSRRNHHTALVPYLEPADVEPAPKRLLLSLDEAAALTPFSAAHLAKQARQGTCPFRVVKLGRRWGVSRASLEEWTG